MLEYTEDKSKMNIQTIMINKENSREGNGYVGGTKDSCKVMTTVVRTLKTSDFAAHTPKPGPSVVRILYEAHKSLSKDSICPMLLVYMYISVYRQKILLQVSFFSARCY